MTARTRKLAKYDTPTALGQATSHMASLPSHLPTHPLIPATTHPAIPLAPAMDPPKDPSDPCGAWAVGVGIPWVDAATVNALPKVRVAD